MLKTGWKIAFALFYTTAAYAGGQCAKTYYCYHHCGDSGQPFPKILACSHLSGGGYSLLANPAGPTIDCNSTVSDYTPCPGYITNFVNDQNIFYDNNAKGYKCKGLNKGPSTDRNNVVQTIKKHCG